MCTLYTAFEHSSPVEFVASTLVVAVGMNQPERWRKAPLVYICIGRIKNIALTNVVFGWTLFRKKVLHHLTEKSPWTPPMALVTRAVVWVDKSHALRFADSVLLTLEWQH